MASRNSAGHLLIIGGAEDKEGDCVILRRFVQLAGGPHADIVVITTATDFPEEVGEEYTTVLHRLGAHNVEVLDLRTRDDADAPAAEASIREAGGVLFTGGDQQRIVETIKGTAVGRALHECYRSGMTIAGTSAGAAMMADPMIVKGESRTNPGRDIVQLGPGMGFLPNVVICMHFANRGRSGRLLSAISFHPGYIGLGIDEDTALVVYDGEFEVIGEGAVFIYDMSGPEYHDLTRSENENNLALTGITLHVLPAGYRYNLETRTPIAEKAPTKSLKGSLT